MKSEKSNVEKFYEWMLRINSIHLANTPAMAAAFKKNSNTKIMKTRVKEGQFKQVEGTDLIGIKWKTGEKGMLLETKEGIICLNNNEMDIRNCIATLTKADYLTREAVKRGQEKVFLFGTVRALLKWFAKK